MPKINLKIFFKRLLLWLLALCLILAIGGWLFVRLYGRELLKDVLTTSLNRTVSFDNIHYHFPFGLQANKVSIEGLLKVDGVLFEIAPESLLRRKLKFYKVVLEKPLINFVKNSNQSILTPDNTSATTVTTPSVSDKKKSSLQFIFERLVIHNGSIFYSNDVSVGEGEGGQKKTFSLELKNVELLVQNISFPLASQQTPFQLSAQLDNIPGPLNGSRAEGTGWINFLKKDMNGRLKAIDKNGAVGLEAVCVSTDNNMRVQGNLNIHELPVKKVETSDSAKNIDDIMFKTLSNFGIQIGAKFSFETKMDDFQINQIHFSGQVVGKNKTDAVGQSSP